MISKKAALSRAAFFIVNISAISATICMLVYTKGIQSDTVVTLNESKTLLAPYYLFVFKSTVLKKTITKVVNSLDDNSAYQNRFNLFQFDTVTLFANETPGQWFYEVYEQASSTNTDPTGLNMVECGKMILKDSSTLTKIGHEPTTLYKGYAG